MKPETIDIITRHLKGIVAALEKEKEEPMVRTFKGVPLHDCSDSDLTEALEMSHNNSRFFIGDISKYQDAVRDEQARRKSIDTKMRETAERRREFKPYP